MRKITATAASAVFLVIAPGVVAGLVPWWLTGWRAGAAYPASVWITGAVLTAAGAAALLTAFAQFATQGQGTPTSPTSRSGVTPRDRMLIPLHGVHAVQQGLAAQALGDSGGVADRGRCGLVVAAGS
jgi:hypothetical protein